MKLTETIKTWLGEKRTRSSKDPSWAELFGVGDSSSGVPVTVDRAEGLSAVYACVGLISESVARLPLHVYEILPDGTRVRRREHYIEQVLNVKPNEVNTPFEIKETLVQNLLLKGNGFAKIHDNARGEVTALEILLPDGVSIEPLQNGRLRYRYADPFGGVDVLTQDEIFHLRGRSADGIRGRSVIQVARDTLGLALAEREHGAALFRNGTRASGILKHPNQLSSDALKRIRESWQDIYGGVGNRGKTPVLDEGMDFTQLSMNNEDAEWVASRRFSFEEVARLFRVPPVLIGDLSHANYSNSVEMMRYFLTVCLGPHLRRLEEAVERCLLPNPGKLYVEFETKALLQTDTKTRFEAYALALDPQKGWMDKNEVRKAENLPPMKVEPSI